MPVVSGALPNLAGKIPLPVLIIISAAVVLVIIGVWISLGKEISGKSRSSDYIGLAIIIALLILVVLMMMRGSGVGV